MNKLNKKLESLSISNQLKLRGFRKINEHIFSLDRINFETIRKILLNKEDNSKVDQFDRLDNEEYGTLFIELDTSCNKFKDMWLKLNYLKEVEDENYKIDFVSQRPEETLKVDVEMVLKLIRLDLDWLEFNKNKIKPYLKVSDDEHNVFLSYEGQEALDLINSILERADLISEDLKADKVFCELGIRLKSNNFDKAWITFGHNYDYEVPTLSEVEVNKVTDYFKIDPSTIDSVHGKILGFKKSEYEDIHF
ncbi:MAG: hypothetical protein GY714_09675 [Desulfobacterales bacterium]|nr:hypothetical protein [Desulfobacterales bacterium]